jgi:uncharacterized RDD family membrane protein YckC
MTKILQKRFLAFFVDYLVITLYAATLLTITLLMYKFFNTPLSFPSPYVGQIIGFATLTLPVFAYFCIFENSKWKGTIGKKKLGIHVETGNTNSLRKILVRNIVKFLPWEIAHTGVHWLAYFLRTTNEVPYWNWILLIAPQLIVVVYLFSLFYYNGKSSFYDEIAKTKILITV